MASTLPRVIANFETTLSAKLTTTGTSLALTSATDSDGNTLAAGTYAFTINEGKANEEHVIGTLSGTTVSSLTRNLSRSDGTTAGTGKEHRKGSSIKITNHPVLVRIVRILQGTDGLDTASPLKYSSAPTLTPGSHQLSTVAYSESLANAGAATASTGTKGVVKISTTPADPANPIAVGDNDTRMPSANEKSALTSLAAAILPYAADAGSTDSYAVTLSPAPTAYTAGMVVNFKANTVNTGAATLNVNGLGAKTIVKNYNLTLHDGDIKAGQLVSVIYDGTNFQLLSPVINAYKSGVTTKDMTAASEVVTIAHGLGAIPRRIRLVGMVGTSSTSNAVNGQSQGTYDGTTNNCIFLKTEVGNAGTYSNSNTEILRLYTNTGAYQTAVATFDSTNITLTWTKSGTPTAGTAQILWEAFA